jgi:peptidoglycan/xylan/chitin deacetylase (PgdA/CDA1 family)
MLLALKIDVTTLRGTREGVPRLTDMLQRHGAGATFLFNVGPDRTGRALRRLRRESRHAGRPGLIAQYGLTALLYGTLLPAPDIGRRAGEVMRSVREAGFETGVQAYDPVRWRERIDFEDAGWTEAEMQRAIDRYTLVFGEPPRIFGAPGWQTNRHALRLTQRMGFDYCSDGRGEYPYLPVWNGELVRCPQLPTSLPTLDESNGSDAKDAGEAVDRLLRRTNGSALEMHVYSARAEIEGIVIAAAFEALLVGWKAQGWTIVPLRTLYDAVEPMALPRCEVGTRPVPGTSGAMLVQGEEFLGGIDLPEPV